MQTSTRIPMTLPGEPAAGQAIRALRRSRWHLHVLLLCMAFLTCYPFLWMLSTSLGNSDNVFAFPPELWPRGASLAHFARVLSAIPVGAFYKNSLLISGQLTVLTLLVSSLTAYPLSVMQFPGRRIVFGAILATLMLPTEVNFINNFITLTYLGLDNTHLGVVLPGVATAFGIFLMKQAFDEVPREIIDAARVDGATEWQVFWRICLPLVKPYLATLGIFTLVLSWNAYVWPSVVLKDPELYPLSVGVLYLKGAFATSTRMVAAGAVLTVAPVLLVFLFTQRYFMRGLDGALK